MKNSRTEIPTSRPIIRGAMRDYLDMARIDHSTKHIFILPGMILACLLRGFRGESLVVSVGFGLLAAVCVASANYVINEWLDRETDKFHPTKSQRPAVQKVFRPEIVLLEWVAFVVAGLICALIVSVPMFLVAFAFALQGVVYNVPPLRAKDVPYFDVIAESINNPLRLTIGWLMVDPTTLPPSSIILLCWSGGAFLMAAKRLSEFKEIEASHGKQLLSSYRASFAGYSETSLTISCFVYALCASFFLAIFLIKYRVEYVLVVPATITLFAYYFALAMKPGSSAQKPELLHREKGIVILVLVIATLFFLLSFVDIPPVELLAGQRYISLE